MININIIFFGKTLLCLYKFVVLWIGLFFALMGESFVLGVMAHSTLKEEDWVHYYLFFIFFSMYIGK